MRSHYRGHKMSLWLSLIPQLHRPGSDLPDAAMRHHHFQEDNANYYEGINIFLYYQQFNKFCTFGNLVFMARRSNKYLILYSTLVSYKF